MKIKVVPGSALAREVIAHKLAHPDSFSFGVEITEDKIVTVRTEYAMSGQHLDTFKQLLRDNGIDLDHGEYFTS